MSKLASLILRTVPAAFIINSGVGKLGADQETSAGLQQFAMTGIPALKKLPSGQFAKILGAAETSLGVAMLAPVVSNKLAGAGLAAFGSGLLTMYFNNENMTEADGIRPTEAGLAMAKDSWLVAIGAALVVMDAADDVKGFRSDWKIRKAEKKAKKMAKKLEHEKN